MPGSGKSTVGIILAKRLSYGFIDTDILIQTSERRSLQTIVDNDGYMVLRNIEERVILDINCSTQVIATGGSAVYSQQAMSHLKELGDIIFLDVKMSVLINRIKDMATRGLARRPDQSFDDLFAERSALYGKYAEITIHCSTMGVDEICDKVVETLALKI